MLKRLLLCVSLIGLVLPASGAEGGQRPVGEAIRAAAEAVRQAVVDVETERGRAHGLFRGMPRPFVVPRPGEEEGQEWHFEFRFPPGMDVPEPFRFGRGRWARPFGGPRRCAGLIVSVEEDRALVAAPFKAVEDAEEATVRLADGRELKARVLGSDQATGLACLEVRGKELVAAQAAAADAAQAGEWVLTVGGPRSGGAVTVGILSATDRPGHGPLAGTKVHLTDAFVPETGAGSPVVTLEGEVLGMALAGGRRGRDLTPILPVATLRATLQDLDRHGQVARGWLGVHLAPQPLGGARCVLVAQALPGQPAANAGIQAGDRILELGGKAVETVDDLRALVATRKPGERVAVKLLRGNQELILEVTLGEQPARGRAERRGLPRGAPEEPEAPEAAEAAGEELLPGLTVQPLTPALAGALGFGGDKGLLITAVEPDSPAAKARPAPVRRGDLLKEIDRKPVATLDEAKAAIQAARDAKAKALLVLVRNQEGARYLVLDLPQEME